MAVNNNPYHSWQNLRLNADYRSTDTQVTSLVRQQLSQTDYLRNSNRVNPGPYRNLRTRVADSTPQVPHVFGAEDVWGWQSWPSKIFTENITISSLAPDLYEEGRDVPGSSYLPYNLVGGASFTDTLESITLSLRI